MHYCYQCKDFFHIGYSCEEYKQTKDPSYTEQMLQKMGIKKCQKCKTPIQKDGGCNHVTCLKCHSHICWKCEKVFPNSPECYNHLAKVCGGIFDADVNQN